MVFFTADPNSALIYARKAVKRFGGEVLVLRIVPDGPIVTIQPRAGTTVYAAPRATVL